MLGKSWVLKTEGKNLCTEHVKALLPHPLSSRIVKELRVEINILVLCMTKKKKFENNPKPLPKSDKSKGTVTLGRSTFIENIIKKDESQPSVGPRKVASRQPIGSLRAKDSPSIAFAKVHSKTEKTEKDFQEIENPRPISLQERNSSNLCEGEGETGET